MSIDDLSWKGWFTPVILSRGREYYRSGCVLDVEETEDGYEATVEGSELYDVSVVVENGRFVDAYCDCPYSEDGNYCKHEAALLYYLSAGNRIRRQCADATDGDAELDRIIGKLSEKDAKAILQELCRKDKDARAAVFSRLDAGLPKKLALDIKREAKRHIGNLEEYEYEGWDDIEDGLAGLSSFISDRLHPLLGRKGCSAVISSIASDMAAAIPFDELMDFGHEGVFDVIESLEDIITEAYGNANDKEKAAIERDIRKRSESGQDFFLQLLMDVFHDKSAAEARLSEIEHMEAEDAAYLLMERISLMEMLGRSDEDIMAVLMESSASPDAASIIVARLLRQGRWKEAVDLIEKRKKSTGSYFPCFDELKGIYRAHGMKAELARLLEEDLESRPQWNLEEVKELRSLVPDDEWDRIYDKLKHSDSLRSQMAAMFSFFGDYGALMDYIEANGSSRDILKYRKELEPLFPERVLAVFCSILDRLGSELAGRGSYAGYASMLKAMSDTPEGRRLAELRAAEILFRYPNRPALRDELAKAGF